MEPAGLAQAAPKPPEQPKEKLTKRLRPATMVHRLASDQAPSDVPKRSPNPAPPYIAESTLFEHLLHESVTTKAVPGNSYVNGEFGQIFGQVFDQMFGAGMRKKECGKYVGKLI